MIRWLYRLLNKEYRSGFEKGERDGYIKGSQEGHEVAKQLGEAKTEEELARLRDVEATRRRQLEAEMQAEIETAREIAYTRVLIANEAHVDIAETLDEGRQVIDSTVRVGDIHPNIYECHGVQTEHGSRGTCYEVRVLVANRVQSKRFFYTVANRQQKLLEAILHRNQLVGDDHVYEELFDDFYRDQRPGTQPVNPTHDVEAVRELAIQFHRRMLVHDIAIADSRFLGDDPALRFDQLDSVLFTRRWTSVIDMPQRGKNALFKLGLRDRMVRDVLLITPRQCREIQGCGRHTIEQMRDAMRAVGLAFMGDPTPAGTAPRHVRNNRRQPRRARGIQLD